MQRCTVSRARAAVGISSSLRLSTGRRRDVLWPSSPASQHNALLAHTRSRTFSRASRQHAPESADAASPAKASAMRLLAIPLARARQGAHPIVTYVAHRPKALEKDKPSSEAKPSLLTRALNKASNFWMDLGKPGQKSTFDWKRRTYNAGEKLMDRIEYQEWSLKGIDPALGPSLSNPSGRHDEDGKQSEQQAQPEKPLEHVRLLYASPSTGTPSFTTAPTVLLSSLSHLVTSRAPHHRQRLIYCVAGMPITIPFALIPVVPNLPFFYLCWRAFSHWKAYKASDYLIQLIKQGRILPTHSSELDAILSTSADETRAQLPKAESSEDAAKKPSSSTKAEQPEADADERMVLQPHHIDLLMQRFDLDRQAGIDLRRAREQMLAHLQQTAEEARLKAAGDAAKASEVKVSAAARHTLEELERTADAADKMLEN